MRYLKAVPTQLVRTQNNLFTNEKLFSLLISIIYLFEGWENSQKQRGRLCIGECQQPGKSNSGNMGQRNGWWRSKDQS